MEASGLGQQPSSFVLSGEGALRSHGAQAEQPGLLGAIVQTCELREGLRSSTELFETLNIAEELHVPGRRMVLLTQDGAFAAQICKVEALQGLSGPLSLCQMIPPAHGQHDGCLDIYQIRCHNGACYQARRSYPALQGTILRLSPESGEALERCVDISTAQAAESSPAGCPETTSQEVLIRLHGAATPFQLSLFAMTAAVMKESTFTPHLRLPPEIPPIMPSSMQGNLKHYANMNHLPPGNFLSENPADQARFKASEASSMGLLAHRDFASLGWHLLKLLDQVNDRPYLYSKSGASVAVDRYERCWLPLLVAHGSSDQPLYPPLDVAWVWFVHAICPQRYAEDVLNSTGCPAHSFSSQPVICSQTSLLKAQKLWREMYPAEPFEMDKAAVAERHAHLQSHPAVSKLKYKIADAVDRQQAFWYQVSLPHYRDKQFLQAADRNYRQFLLLHQQNPGNFIVPSFDMDLLWHAHQACHAMYLEDCQAAFGKLFGHDDSINDRAPGLQLENGFQRTARLYAETFGRPYTVAGGMWRGPAPPTNMASSPFRAGTADTHANRPFLEGQAPSDNPSGPSVGVLQDSTNASRNSVSSAQVQYAGPWAGHAQAGEYIPGSDVQQEAAASQGKGRQHVQDGGVVGRTTRKGFLQRVSQLLRPSKGGSTRKASKQEKKSLVQEPSDGIVHQFRVTPAAARDSSGDALGYKDGAVILPCYEADQALSDPVCRSFAVCPESKSGEIMNITLQHQGLASHTAAVAVSMPQTDAGSSQLEAAAWMVGTESLPVNWTDQSANHPCLAPGQSAFLIAAAGQDWGLCIAEWVDPPDPPTGQRSSGSLEAGQLEAFIHRLGPGSSSTAPYVALTSRTPAGQVWEVRPGSPSGHLPTPQPFLRVHLGLQTKVELADGLEQGPWIALAFVLSLQATLLGLAVDGYIHPGYTAGFMAAPGLALPLPIPGPPAGHACGSDSAAAASAPAAHFASKQQPVRDATTGHVQQNPTHHPHHHPSHGSEHSVPLGDEDSSRQARSCPTPSDPPGVDSLPEARFDQGQNVGTSTPAIPSLRHVDYQPVAGCRADQQLYLPSRTDLMSHHCFRAQVLQQ